MPLTHDEAISIVKSRIVGARDSGTDESGSLFPFRDVLPFRPDTYSNPRRLVKTCFAAISDASRDIQVPFQDSYLSGIERKLYPLDDGA